MRGNEEDNPGLLLERGADNILHESESLPGVSPKIVASPTSRKVVDGKENNSDLILSPSGTPFTSLFDAEPQKNITAQNQTTKVCSSEKKFTDCQDDSCNSSEESCKPSSSKPDNPTDEPYTPPPSAKSLSPVMPSSTHTTITSARTSTRTVKPKGQACNSTPKSGITPTTRPSKPSSNMSAPSGKSSSTGKLSHKTIRNPALSGGNSTGRSRPQKHSEIPESVTDAPEDVTSSVGSGTRNSSGKPRRSSPTVRRVYSEDGENVSPAQVGTKMVERVVNMRRLAPPKLEGKSRCHGSSGFGRSLSKNSLDMALRHMDIGQNVSGNLRPLVTKAPASGVKSGLTQNRSSGVSKPSVVTSGNADSELSLDTHKPDNDLGSGRS